MSFDVRSVAERLGGCSCVTGLHAGPLGTIVTPTDAGPVIGIRVHTAMIVLGIVAPEGVDEADVAADVRARLSPVTDGVPISLCIRRPDVVRGDSRAVPDAAAGPTSAPIRACRPAPGRSGHRSSIRVRGPRTES